MGSALFLTSWAVLMGPMIYGKHRFARHLLCTDIYFRRRYQSVPVAFDIILVVALC